MCTPIDQRKVRQNLECWWWLRSSVDQGSLSTVYSMNFLMGGGTTASGSTRSTDPRQSTRRTVDRRATALIADIQETSIDSAEGWRILLEEHEAIWHFLACSSRDRNRLLWPSTCVLLPDRMCDIARSIWWQKWSNELSVTHSHAPQTYCCPEWWWSSKRCNAALPPGGAGRTVTWQERKPLREWRALRQKRHGGHDPSMGWRTQPKMAPMI